MLNAKKAAPPKWTANTVIRAAINAGVSYVIHPDWKKISPYGDNKGWTDLQEAPVGVVWHHTGCGLTSTSDYPSLTFVLNGSNVFKGQARSCNVLLDRKGVFHFIGAYAQYHAGEGGPVKVAGKLIPEDQGNRWLIGVEIEAHNSDKLTPYVKGKMSGITTLQMEAMSKWCAALADLQDWPTTSFIRHRDWTDGGFDGNPVLSTKGRKIDVVLPLATIRKTINRYRSKQG